MTRLQVLLIATIFLIRNSVAEFELDDLNDDSFTRKLGDPAKCPEKIRFRTENSLIRSDRIRINEGTDCPEGVNIQLVAVTGPVAAASAPVRFFASRIGDVERFYQGRNSGDLTCGAITFPTGLQWIFLEPDEELDDVEWAEVYNGTPDFAEDEDDEFDFDDNERYLLVGDICFYEDSSITDSVCFPADANVKLEDGSLKTMDKLSIGDRVHVGDGIYSDVFAWTHQNSRKNFKFVQLTTEHGDSLTATGSHYIYADGQSMQMKHVRVGMSLRQADGSAARVVKKEKVIKSGLYNPQTVHGDIVVDGFVATTYTSAVQPEAAHALLAPVRAAFQVVKGLLPVGEASA